MRLAKTLEANVVAPRRSDSSATSRTVRQVDHSLPEGPAAGTELLDEYRRLAAHAAERRERATQLRALAEHAEAQAERDERMLTDIGGALGLTAQLCLEEVDPRLRGARLEEIAVELLRRADAGAHGLHYRDWFALLRRAGHHVGGKDPLATFLAQINRSSAVERIGQRSGRYRLRVAA